VIHIAGAILIGLENASAIALKGRAYTDSGRNGPVVVDGLLDIVHRGNAVVAPYIGPGNDLLVMCVWWVARTVSGLVGKIGLMNRPRTGLTWWHLIPMVIVGPPPAIATPAICVARNQILL
jgi:hypothetical protein